MIIELTRGELDNSAVIKKINPKPGDVFVLKMKRKFGDEPMLDKLGGALKEAAGGEIKLIVLDFYAELCELTDEMLEQSGLCRKEDSRLEKL